MRALPFHKDFSSSYTGVLITNIATDFLPYIYYISLKVSIIILGVCIDLDGVITRLLML